MANILHVERAANKITLGTTGTTINIASHTALLSLGLDASKNLESIDLSAIYQPLDAVLTDLAALDVVADNEFIVGTEAGVYAHESGATARTSIGLGIGDSPTFAGLDINGAIDLDVIFTADNQIGVDSLANFNHEANIATGRCGSFVATNISAYAITNQLTGLRAGVTQNGSGLITSARALLCYVDNTSTGDITHGYGIVIEKPVVSSTGVIDNLYGIVISPQKQTGVTVAYGLWLSGANDLNYFAGKVGIGSSAPKTLLTVEGTLTLKEQAAADGDTASYGQIWVKTATPNELWFTDDAGTDHQIAYV